MSTVSALGLEFIQNLADLDAVTKSSDWGNLSLASGYPGLILFFSQLGKEKQWEPADQIVHQYVLKLKECIETEGIASLSLYGGAAGIAFALERASCAGMKYQRMLHSVHQFLLQQIESLYLAPLEKNILEGSPSSADLYDPIQGISGIGRYIIEHLDFPGFENLAKRITKDLVRLGSFIYCQGKHVPGWYMPAEDRLNIKNRARDPKGNFNAGLAHGVTGILAFLAIALIQGVEVNGQREAISQMATWIRSKSWSTPQGIAWPYSVSWEEEIKEIPPKQQNSRDAWCYGAPGICRTLCLAGQAIHDPELQYFAQSSFRNVFLRSREQWHLPGPTLCHGIAGLLLIAQAMGETAHCEELTNLVLSSLQADSKWGFKDAEPCGNHQYRFVDKVGFLEGSVGVWLTLLSQDRKWALPLMIDA